jgi:hypothetical protein
MTMCRSKTLFVLGIGLSIVGCNPIYYSPNTQNVLIAPAAGDLTAAAAYDGNRAEVQASYAINDALALQVNGGLYEPDDLDNGDGGSGRFLEVGAGYFSPIGDAFFWEVIGLLGVGSFENHFPSTVDSNPGTTGEISADLVRFGIQPALGYRSRYIDAAVSSRILRMSFREVEGSLLYDGEDQTALLEEGLGYLLFEPAVTVRAGLDRVKLQLQAGRSFNLTDSDFRQDESMASVGFVVVLPTRR